MAITWQNINAQSGSQDTAIRDRSLALDASKAFSASLNGLKGQFDPYFRGVEKEAEKAKQVATGAQLAQLMQVNDLEGLKAFRAGLGGVDPASINYETLLKLAGDRAKDITSRDASVASTNLSNEQLVDAKNTNSTFQERFGLEKQLTEAQINERMARLKTEQMQQNDIINNRNEKAQANKALELLYNNLPKPIIGKDGKEIPVEVDFVKLINKISGMKDDKGRPLTTASALDKAVASFKESSGINAKDARDNDIYAQRFKVMEEERKKQEDEQKRIKAVMEFVTPNIEKGVNRFWRDVDQLPEILEVARTGAERGMTAGELLHALNNYGIANSVREFNTTGALDYINSQYPAKNN